MFVNNTTYFATSLELDRYVYTTCRNWDNYILDNEVVADNEKNDKETEEDMERLLDNPYALYGMYN